MQGQLLAYHVQEGDSEYNMKQENIQLQSMVQHYVMHAKKLEEKLEGMEQQMLYMSREGEQVQQNIEGPELIDNANMD